jgi:hypothetical protein
MQILGCLDYNVPPKIFGDRTQAQNVFYRLAAMRLSAFTNLNAAEVRAAKTG